MEPLNLDQTSSLEWRQTGALTRSYELVDRQSLLVGVLEFSTALGSRAEGRISDAAWSFKRTGFFSTVATARVPGTEENVAVYQPNWSGARGVITLASGERIILQRAGFWGGEWLLLTESGSPMVRFHNRGVIRHGAGVDVEAEARRKPELALLLLFAWYVLILYQQDSSAAAVIAATAG